MGYGGHGPRFTQSRGRGRPRSNSVPDCGDAFASHAGAGTIAPAEAGGRSRGLGSGHTQLFLPVWLQKTFGSWTTYGGVGYWINPGAGNRNWWFTGWLIQKKVSRNLTVGAEIFHETAQSDDGRSDTKANVGLIWDLDETRHILASIGPTLQGPAGYQAYLALQFTFGPAK